MSKSTFNPTQKAWAFYDWANSVYSLVITTAIFPIFYAAVVPDEVSFFGSLWVNTELYTYILAASFLLVAFMSPFLSGISDVKGNKKSFLSFFCTLGSISCVALYFFEWNFAFGLLCVFLASIGFWGSLVFYNAYLPELAVNEEQDALSARGFSYGYIGSSFLLIALLVAIQVFGMPAKWAFVITGVWWLGFAQVTLRKMPVIAQKLNASIWSGFEELKVVWRKTKEVSGMRWFLVSFFVYSMGVQTVMIMATLFGAKEIVDMPDAGLIISVLLIQFLAAFGAEFSARLAKKFGGLSVIKGIVLGWVGICLIAYYIQFAWQFYLLACFVGLVMGGVQSLSRSTYSNYIPGTTDTASFFSFFDVTEKIGIVIGMVAYGAIEGLTGSMRNSVLALIVFFVLGWIALHRTQKAHKRAL